MTGWLTVCFFVWGLRLVCCLVVTYRSLRSQADRVEGIKQDPYYQHDPLFSPLDYTSTRPGPYRRHPLSYIPLEPSRQLPINDFLRRPSFSRSAFTPTPHPLHPHHLSCLFLLTFRATRWQRLRYASFCISSSQTHFVFLYLHETMDDFAITISWWLQATV